jgi:hypothetical protein
MGRAPLTVLGYLTLVEGYSTEQALNLIHEGRPEAVPSLEAYCGCCEDLIAQHREAIKQRAYELYEQGIHRDALADWTQAKAEILRAVLK